MVSSASQGSQDLSTQLVSSTIQASTCAACGTSSGLLQCSSCSTRLNNVGTRQALCKPCVSKPEEVSSFGSALVDPDDSSDIIGFVCSPCSRYIKRKQQEKVFETLKGPSAESILRTISGRFPWAIEIQQASSSDLLEALQFCKRKLSGMRTIEALAENLANENTHAALLLQHMGASVTGNNDSIANKALKTFVKNQCPAVKYKTLLLPPTGSLLKAQRHFSDMLKVEDSLVVALANERLFLCSYFENQYLPLQSEQQRKKGITPDVPDFALHLLRATLKSLSTGIKASARKDSESDILVKTFYQDHITWASNWATMSMLKPVENLKSGYTPTHFQQGKGNGKGAKDWGKDFSKERSFRRDDKPNYSQEPQSKAPRFSAPSASMKVQVQPGHEALLKHLQQASNHQQAISLGFNNFPESGKFWQEWCRNCYSGGKGLLKHSLPECQKLKNECFIRCIKCKQGNHWASECPMK